MPVNVTATVESAASPCGAMRLGRTHESVGAGIYSFFRDSQCLVPAAVAAPPTANFTNAFTKHLNGHPGILSVT